MEIEFIITYNITYNFVLLGLDILSILFVLRRRSLVAWFVSVLSVAASSVLVAGLIGHLTYLGLRLLSFGWFLHVPCVSRSWVHGDYEPSIQRHR